ncbi:MAG: potassium/proton antiporter [Bacteroidales bacterium]|nr:potassium/proton antiporter [Bacteroidales bacterium]
MTFSIELILLGVSLLFLLSIVAGKAGDRFGVPALLLFLLMGMLIGSDGLGIQFENIAMANNIGMVALIIILFSGGMDTKIKEIKPVVAQGVVLSTFGVFLTALSTGFVVWWVFGWTLPSAGLGLVTAMLMASTMSSTDSASVFSILRSRGVNLKHNLRPMLELESGSNDPVAFVLTATLIDLINQELTMGFAAIIGIILLQLVIGAIAGYVMGRLTVVAINNLKVSNASFYPFLVLTFALLTFSATYFLKGNGYLAVYIAGLVVGNARFIHKRPIFNFFDGVTWISQLLMFLTLGLLVNPHELVPIIVPGLLISVALIMLTRPLSVFLCLLPFRHMPVRDKTFVSWVGLKGAVPIIFAIMTLAADVPNARLIFNTVFFITLVSLVVQGTSLTRVAKWLKLADKPVDKRTLEHFDVEFSDEMLSQTAELVVHAEALKNGKRLVDLSLPDTTLVVMVKRGERYFVPKGQTLLSEGDKLLILADTEAAIKETQRYLCPPKVKAGKA